MLVGMLLREAGNCKHIQHCTHHLSTLLPGRHRMRRVQRKVVVVVAAAAVAGNHKVVVDKLVVDKLVVGTHTQPGHMLLGHILPDYTHPDCIHTALRHTRLDRTHPHPRIQIADCQLGGAAVVDSKLT